MKTTKDAMKALGVTKARISALRRAKKVPAGRMKVVDGRYTICWTEEEFQELLRKRGKA